MIQRSSPLPAWLFLLLFTALAVLVRFLSFRFSVIDPDESTYLVIAQELLKGQTFYVDVWDTKPIGIFLIFAGIIGTLGHSIVSARLAAAVTIGLTAFLLYLAARRWNPQNRLAWIAGLAYILASSVHRWNFAANTEIFFNLFTALGLFFFLGKKGRSNFFLTGLVFGLGFIIKYFVVFDLLAIWIFYLLTVIRERQAFRIQELGWNTASMGLGFLLPFSAVVLYYWQNGLFSGFWFATYVVPGRYAEGFSFSEALNYFANFHLVYAPLVILAYAVIIRGSDRPLAWLGTIWLVLVWVILILPGKFFFHYYFQLLVPLCFLLPGIAGVEIKVAKVPTHTLQALLAVLAIGFLAWNTGSQARLFIRVPDVRRDVAAYLESRMTKEDILYCNKSAVLYFLLEKSPPVKYVHPTLLTNPAHYGALGIDPEEELRRVAGQRPQFMVIEGTPIGTIEELIRAEYLLETEFSEGFRVYARK
jgi:4-amino-4-deoxy-L-arabinose transferase-like glycosyltransferase